MNGLENIFMQHVADFGLSYGTIEEFNFRKNIFANNHNEIEAINSSNGTSTAGHNFLSTWTQGEKKVLLGYNGLGEVQFGEELPAANAASVNWVTAGAVNPVQNQASCGSCWAFSTMAAVEGAHYVATSKLVKLSEEQLVDCSRRNHGCGGGSMALAFKYLEKSDADTEASYPYSAGHGKAGTCKQSTATDSSVKVTTYTNVSQNNPDQLKAAIAQSVVSVAIQADQTVFQHYTSGVITQESCGTNLDHGVAAVGYGTENGQEYFLVRNSWGPTWGDAGYVKIGVAAGKGICGINMGPVWPKTN